MKNLRVLSIRQCEDDNYQTSSLRGHTAVIDSLRKYIDVTEMWVVEKGGSFSGKYIPGVFVYNVFSFKNAIEALERLQPEVILVYNGDFEFLSRSLLKAGSHKGVPSVDIRFSDFDVNSSESKNLAGAKVLNRICTLSRKGRMITRKYLFLLRTLNKSGSTLWDTTKTIFKDFYLSFAYWSPMYQFGGADLNIVSTPEWLNLVLRKGIPRNKIAVTGDISMDSIFEHLSRIKRYRDRAQSNQSKVEILFITDSMVEHGYWSPQQRDRLVTSVVRNVEKELGSKANLRVKIHPTSESLGTYTNLLSPIDPSLKIIQNSDLILLIDESDIIITFGFSSAILQAILLGKPVYLMNIYANNKLPENPFVQEEVVVECQSINELMDKIKRPNYAGVKDERLQMFIEKYLYRFDGKCGERAAKYILSMLHLIDQPN